MARAQERTRTLVLMQYVDGKPVEAFVYNEDAKTERGWKNHAEKQASFMSREVRATCVDMRPREAADYMLRMIPDLIVSVMGNQRGKADDYFTYDGRKEPSIEDMLAHGFIPTVTPEVAIPF